MLTAASLTCLGSLSMRQNCLASYAHRSAPVFAAQVIEEAPRMLTKAFNIGLLILLDLFLGGSLNHEQQWRYEYCGVWEDNEKVTRSKANKTSMVPSNLLQQLLWCLAQQVIIGEVIHDMGTGV